MTKFGAKTTGAEVVDHYHNHVNGRTILITGTSDGGLGAETAITLARAGPAQLILLARSLNKVEPVIAKIKKANSNVETFFVPIELDKTPSIAEAAKQIHANEAIKKIDIVINNAGIMATPYKKNDAGIESQLATNHIGHFYLTKHIFPLILAAGKGARIVNLTSDGYMISAFRFDDYNFSDGKTYDIWSGYGQSKTANVLFTRQLASKLADRGISAFVVHPGVIMSTSIGGSVDESAFNELPAIAKRNTGVDFKMGEPKTAQQGVSTTLVAALDPSLSSKSGSLLMDCNVEPIMDYASSSENAEQLWKLSEKLINEKWDLDAQS